MSRPSWDEYFLKIALDISSRSTCYRRAVGCVLVDHGHKILSTGYNGVASGRKHCNERGVLRHVDMSVEAIYPYACEGAQAASGFDLDSCEAIHAEQNALLQCSDVTKIHTVYVTTEPCVTCTKLLLSTGAKRVVFLSQYSQSGSHLWDQAWIQLDPDRISQKLGEVDSG